MCTANELNVLHAMIMKGWPDTRSEVPHAIREYWSIRDELAVIDGVVYKGMRIVVPPSMRNRMLAQIHGSHLGIVKCKKRAREALYWPGMNQHIERLVQDCAECNSFQNRQPAEPLKPTKLPDLPWTEVGTDLFEWESSTYLLVVDYFSKFIEVDKMASTSSTSVIDRLKKQFARHGLPLKLRSDNGPQYSSREFQEFCKSYGIEHVTSSPRYPQANGEAERAVQTVKRMWRKCADKQLALLDYRTTPLASCDLSPAQLLMGRRPRNLLPTSKNLLQPKEINLRDLKESSEKQRADSAKYYNAKAGKDLPPLHPGDPVRMVPLPGTNKWLPATIIRKHDTPKSYVVESDGKLYRRNTRDLRKSTEAANKPHNQPADKGTTPRPVPVSQQSPTLPAALQRDPNIEQTKQTSPQTPIPAAPDPPPDQIKADRAPEMTSQPHYKTRSGRVSKPPSRLIMN